MNITTTCTDRKPMARGLAEHLGCDCEYLRAPTYAFRVGSLQVERDGSITGERTDLEAAAGWLLENGYISEPLPTELKKTSKEDFQPGCLRGRRLSLAMKDAICSSPKFSISTDLGQYSRIRPFAFSFVPRSHGVLESKRAYRSLHRLPARERRTLSRDQGNGKHVC